MDEKIYERKCSVCGKTLTTKNKYWHNKAIRENRLCGHCSLIGKPKSPTAKLNMSLNHANVNGVNNPFYGKKHDDATLQILREYQCNRIATDDAYHTSLSTRMIEWHKHNVNPFYGKKHTADTVQHLSLRAIERFTDPAQREHLSKKSFEWFETHDSYWKGKKLPPETTAKMRESQRIYYMTHVGKWTGRHHSEESKKKMHDIWIKLTIERGCFYNYNKSSIPIIEQYGKDHGYNFQHAENGGEYQVPGTTFYLDGYDIEHNVALEYDEIYHFKGKQPHLDKWRQNIIGKLLKCLFIRIDYENNVLEYTYED